MRLWTIHPQYLDAKGLVALWREGLLAQKVLLNQTNGYRNHPQLKRFKQQADPVMAIGYYLQGIVDEADRRGYHFDVSKIVSIQSHSQMTVNAGQIIFEWKHLMTKLQIRSPERHRELVGCESIVLHPLFAEVEGGVEDWEVS